MQNSNVDFNGGIDRIKSCGVCCNIHVETIDIVLYMECIWLVI